ncbi:MAG: homocysteine S-methyltransferase family protein [Chloroflexi bacterium]|nr:homocysteine S-methyltransferase family protein [Chloroflexota bacterium]
MPNSLLQRLNTTPFLADGAMGTMIHAHGISFEKCFDELSLTQPAVVADIHRAYIDAGTQIILTNTFGSNKYRLSAHGLQNKVKEMNTAAVTLARRVVEASFKEVFIAGDVGPLGARLAPFGRVKPEQAFAAFREQIESLISAGVDLIMIETMSDLYEVAEAVKAARDVNKEIPLIASITFTRDDTTLLGDNAKKVAIELTKMGVDVIGINCSSGPSQVLRLLNVMRRAAPEAKFLVKPNAGWPERIGSRIMYPATPEYFGDYAMAYIDAGASIVGGCCGTTPNHIAAMRAALDSPRSKTRKDHVTVSFVEKEEATSPAEQPTQLAQKLTAKQFVIGVEMHPPRGFSTHKLLAGAHLLSEAGADVINVVDAPMARMRMSAWAVCHLLQDNAKIETVLHFPTRSN